MGTSCRDCPNQRSLSASVDARCHQPGKAANQLTSTGMRTFSLMMLEAESSTSACSLVAARCGAAASASAASARASCSAA